ncbi:MAG: hypothetical protein HYT87_04730 [Nitrospirae bacterium]|nr:hypothetical protein [Nitrospirota bacterium]
MGGICGILNATGHASTGDLHTMLFMLSHRGIGAPGAWSSTPAALGHWDSHTLDPERRGVQPFHDGSNGPCIVFDGRLDHRDALLSDLCLDRATDVELALAAYLRWGDDAWTHLLGDFALALWDPREDCLLLARDPVGVRPLFYSVCPTRFVFASEAKAILAMTDVVRAPDPESMAELKRYRFRRHEYTFFQGILRVRPGQRLRVDRRGIDRRAFWKPVCSPRPNGMEPEEAHNQFRRLFIEAVRDRLPARGTAAIMLSGGLDSSSIAVAASHARGLKTTGCPARLEAYTLLWKDGEDERRLSRIAAEKAGLHVSPVMLDDVELDPTPALVFEHETPLLNPIDQVYGKLYRAAAAAGHRILLNGEWGDDLLHGGAFLADLLVSGRWKAFARQIRGFRDNEGIPIRSMLRYLLECLLLPRRDTPKFATHAQEQIYEAVFVPLKLLAIENLERGAAAHGIEIRLPYLDLRLIEFLFRVPGEWLAEEGIGKQPLRKGLADLLPGEISGQPRKDNTPLFRVPSTFPASGREGDMRAYSSAWSAKAESEWRSVWFGRPAK